MKDILLNTINAAVRKAQLEYGTQNIELVLTFNDAHVSVFIDGKKKESIAMPNNLFKPIFAFMQSLVDGQNAKLVLLRATENNTSLYYETNGEKLIKSL
jgi:hypothetical protein